MEGVRRAPAQWRAERGPPLGASSPAQHGTPAACRWNGAGGAGRPPFPQARHGRRKLEKEGQAHGTCAYRKPRTEGTALCAGRGSEARVPDRRLKGGVAGHLPAGMGCAGDFGSGQGKAFPQNWNIIRTYGSLSYWASKPTTKGLPRPDDGMMSRADRPKGAVPPSW